MQGIAQTKAQLDTGFDICQLKDANGNPAKDAQGNPVSIATCISQIYTLSLGLGSLLALAIMVLAGYRYMAAQGSGEAVQSAKDMFTAAVTGLIIIFVGFILLYVINPDLVQFKNIGKIPIPDTSVKK